MGLGGGGGGLCCLSCGGMKDIEGDGPDRTGGGGGGGGRKGMSSDLATGGGGGGGLSKSGIKYKITNITCLVKIRCASACSGTNKS